MVSAMPSPTASLPSPRREALRDGLPAAVQLLKHRRAAEISPRDIDDYVALNWLEWNGGSLRLTVTGDNICHQVAPPPRDT